MGFFGKEPVDASKCKVSYLWTGYGVPGVFLVEVEGCAPNFSYGFELVRDQQFVGGLKIDCMGCTGPVAAGTTPYSVKGTFPGQFVPKVIISGSNGDFVLDVCEVAPGDVDGFIRAQAEAALCSAKAVSASPVAGANGYVAQVQAAAHAVNMAAQQIAACHAAFTAACNGAQAAAPYGAPVYGPQGYAKAGVYAQPEAFVPAGYCGTKAA